jgi:Domain of unknown function (DUF4337)
MSAEHGEHDKPETHEKAEHDKPTDDHDKKSAESHEHKSNFGMRVGLTMALLGVLLAISAAFVGATRNSLIAATIEETRTSALCQSIATKYRTLMSQLQQLHALLPADEQEQQASNHAIDEVAQGADKTVAPIIKVEQLKTDLILNTVTPTRADVLRFVELVREYQKEKETADKWNEGYEDVLAAYEHADEHYEWGQLCAEFGIVLASVALLLKSRAAWAGSITLGLASLGILIYTFNAQQSALVGAQHEIEENKQAYFALGMHDKHKQGDDELLADIERIEKPVVEKEKAQHH